MRRLWIIVASAIVLLVVVYAAMIAMFETSGEVVELRTLDADGGIHRSRLWIVDVDGDAYLRTGDARASWLQRIRANSHVAVTRDGLTTAYVAVPVENDPALRERVNAATAAKYGVAETLLRHGMLDPARTVPIRLVPNPDQTCEAHSAPC